MAPNPSGLVDVTGTV